MHFFSVYILRFMDIPSKELLGIVNSVRVTSFCSMITMLDQAGVQVWWLRDFQLLASQEDLHINAYLGLDGLKFLSLVP